MNQINSIRLEGRVLTDYYLEENFIEFILVKNNETQNTTHYSIPIRINNKTDIHPDSLNKGTNILIYGSLHFDMKLDGFYIYARKVEHLESTSNSDHKVINIYSNLNLH